MIGVERNPTPPASLAKKKSYKGQDVLEQLEADFHGKCYLCERPVGSDFQVDHLRPRKGYPELEFEWTNLFPACTCNQRRLECMDGRQLSRLLGLTRPDLKVLFMSGYQEEIQDQLEKLGDNIYFLPKPFSSGDLSVKVREVLDA